MQPRNRNVEVHHVASAVAASVSEAAARRWAKTVARSCEPDPMNNPTTITTLSTSTDSNVELIANLYAAYGRGDLHCHGRSEVPGFIHAIAANVDVTEFTVVGMTSNDTDVIATIHWTYTVTTTGKTAAMFMQHWWRIDNGKIVWFRGSEDTEQSAAAFRP